jgi:hypothetical protein
MPDNKLSAKQAHGPTHRFVFEPRGRTDPRSIGLIRGTYDLHDKVLSPPLIVAADHPNAHHVLNEGDEIEVAEDDWALLHLVENIYKDLFRYARCSAPAIEPEPLPAKKQPTTPQIRKHKLTDAINARLKTGHWPPPWPKFCDDVRRDLKVARDTYGYSDKTIQRIVPTLKIRTLSGLS